MFISLSLSAVGTDKYITSISNYKANYYHGVNNFSCNEPLIQKAILIYEDGFLIKFNFVALQALTHHLL